MGSFTSSKSGVKIAENFRENLIIDRYHPCFQRMRASKIKNMCSENSEDVLTWNVFHSLRQINPGIWIPHLFEVAFPSSEENFSNTSIITELWKTAHPPLSILETGDEGDSEIDICIESPKWVWFIEAKLNSSVSKNTTTRGDRDQILRNIDVGSYYAGVRNFYFSLLTLNSTKAINDVEYINKYRDLSLTKEMLSSHRPDGLVNLKAVSHITWNDLARTLKHCSEIADKYENIFADRALTWLSDKKNILP
jgi:hypothetical protein